MAVPPLTLTIDLEDHRASPDQPARYDGVTRWLLDELDAMGVRATVFVVGQLAEAAPSLVAEVAARGHEVALHDWSHLQLDRTDPTQFRSDTQRGRAVLEDLVQAPVVGYRAPTFSLTAETTWATEILPELGFQYSSSILPAANPLYGYPGAPGVPFTWPSGLLELPPPLARAGPLQVPLGGTYLRVLPRRLLRRADGPVPFVYCHPYDFDADEPFWWEPVAGALAPLLWLGRRGMLDKLARMLRPPGPPLCERLDDARAVAIAFDPARPVMPTGGQTEMVHDLPDARCVQRIPYLADLASERSTIHVGFVDSGYRAMQDAAGAWLHAHLATRARTLVGIDLDEAGVEAARDAGYEAYAIDCRDTKAVEASGITPAELVIAGEVIEHLDAPGPFLDALHALVAPGGELVITTPNASGLLNTLAAFAGREVNHPDHVVLFSWRTLQAMLSRHGWEVTESTTYVPIMKDDARRAGVMTVGAAAVLGMERLAGRLGAPFVADGLIVRCRARQ